MIFSEKQHFIETLEKITATRVNNGNKIVLQLKSTDKKLSNNVLRFKTEHSYETVVISKVVLKSPSGSSMKDSSKESQKSTPRPKK